jgi:hypothetical protein
MAREKQGTDRLAYQPPASSSFVSEQTSHQQPASSTFLSEQISTIHQPPAKRRVVLGNSGKPVTLEMSRFMKFVM